MQRKVKAMVNTLDDLDEVEIISEKDNNHVIARYNGKLYTAIYNIFTGLYYVDDKYGEIKGEGDIKDSE